MGSLLAINLSQGPPLDKKGKIFYNLSFFVYVFMPEDELKWLWSLILKDDVGKP